MMLWGWFVRKYAVYAKEGEDEIGLVELVGQGSKEERKIG